MHLAYLKCIDMLHYLHCFEVRSKAFLINFAKQE